jgi:hypothetical protein
MPESFYASVYSSDNRSTVREQSHKLIHYERDSKKGKFFKGFGTRLGDPRRKE